MIKFGLIGKPIKHSLSPKLFNEMFIKNNINAKYELYEINNIDILPQIISTNQELMGINITSPFKQDVLKYIDILTPMAQETDAVNTIYIDRNKQGKTVIIGHNTDIYGAHSLLDDIIDNEKKILILGTGGASKSVQKVLGDKGKEYYVVSRTPGKGHLTYEELSSKNMIHHDIIIINATPLGMGVHDTHYPRLPYNNFTPDCTAIDLIYSPAVTPFMAKMAERGAIVRNGLVMLLCQAQESWKFWQSNLKRENIYLPESKIMPPST